MILVTTDRCPKCPAAKEMLKEKGIKFEVVNAHENADIVAKYRLVSVPALIKDEEVHVGLDEISEAISS